MRFLLDLFCPPRSLTGEQGSHISDSERGMIRPEPVLLDTAVLRARGASSLDALAAGCILDASPLVRIAIHRFKYRGVRALASDLVPFLHSASSHLAMEHTTLCPVPLHWTRYCARGFNQSAVLCHTLATHVDADVALLLRRRRPTGTQTQRTRVQRLEAMRGVFGMRRTAHVPAHVILVDDVATTLATIDACARVLKHAGVRRVDALVIALG